MTADNADGGAMPPTTHFAIRACCLICDNAVINTDCNSLGTQAECYVDSDSDEFQVTFRAVAECCDKFALRDFGYPVRTVEVD